MGIENFFKVEKNGKTIKSMGTIQGDDFLQNQKIAVDAFNIIYGARHVKHAVMTAGNKVTSHIKIILNIILKFQKLNVMHVWIFDGKKSAIKEEYCKNRKIKITGEEIEDVKTLLTICGVAYYVVNTEAEFFAAELCKRGIVDWVYSSDADVIVRGGNLLKGEKLNGKKMFLAIESRVVQQETGLDLDGLTKMAIMLGWDSTPKTPKIGPKTAIKKIETTELTEIQENILKHLRKPVEKGSVMLHNLGQKDLNALAIYLRNLEFSETTIKKATEQLADF
jgi:5'-3' exonuclease